MRKEATGKLKLMRANHGFSLIEIIIAMAVLLIIIFAFTTLFTFAFGGIFTQGRKSEALYKEVQKELEVLYEAQESTGTSILEITFDNANDVDNVLGEYVHKQFTYDDKTGVVYTFIPNSQ